MNVSTFAEFISTELSWRYREASFKTAYELIYSGAASTSTEGRGRGGKTRNVGN